jgi:hypothetical protein
MAAIRSLWVSPRKGGSPAAISYSKKPTLKTSLRASTFNPRACSGDLCRVVSTTIPGMLSGPTATGLVVRRRVGRDLHEAEVEELHETVLADHDVLGFDVAKEREDAVVL